MNKNHEHIFKAFHKKEKVAALETSQVSLKKEVDETRTACQDEALKRVNCENQIATLSETLDFERKISKDRLRIFRWF